MKTYLVTGSAGFIGNFVAERLLNDGHIVVGVDNLNDYYDRKLKDARLERLKGRNKFYQFRMDLEDSEQVLETANEFPPDVIIHLAAQAGVRHSLEEPQQYVDSNITGFLTVLECARVCNPAHLVFASTSSVYGLDSEQPMSEHRGTNHPASIYAATKKANEVMAHSYSHLFDIPATGLRLFTVYGPWGRPDMALFKFTEAILRDKPVPLFNHGKMIRDFTFIDDIVECIVRIADMPPVHNNDWNASVPDPASSSAPYRLLNVGNSNPVELMDYVKALEKALDKQANLDMLPMQPGDILNTWADTTDLERLIAFQPSTPIEEGIQQFVEWYRQYYRT